MPKIIFTSRYIKNPASSNAGKLIKYMGTREGVENCQTVLITPLQLKSKMI